MAISSAAASKPGMTEPISIRRRNLEDALMRWKRSVRRLVLVIIAGVAVSCAVGYWTTVVLAQQAQQAQQAREAVQVAVNAQRIDDLQAAEGRLTIRLDDMDGKLGTVTERLATMQGEGMGAITLLTILNLAGVALHMRNKKPA